MSLPFWLRRGRFCYGTSGTVFARNADIRIDPTEIADARWFSKEQAAALLAGNHPENLIAPKPYAIAYHLVRAALAGM